MVRMQLETDAVNPMLALKTTRQAHMTKPHKEYYFSMKLGS